MNTRDPDSGTAGMAVVSDATRMRALAHPARLSILDYLAGSGPATATECARVVHLSPSATSYHLRALARAGYIEEAEGRGDGRERFWRTAAEHLRVDGDEEDAGYRAAESALVDAVLVWQDARTRQFLSTMYDTETPAWRQASAIGERAVEVTAEELAELVVRIYEMTDKLSRSTRPEPPPGARRVLVMLRAIPAMGVAPEEM